ncbi:MAG: TIGR04211 family SH3 domain-containing protein [Acidiferrobacterales bacterium]
MNKKMITVGILLFLFGLPALGDTVYIKERLTAAIRADQLPDSAVVGRVQTGTGLELLEQGGDFTKVRTTDGVEGWVANSFITRDKPAAMRILAAETRLKAAQAENNQLKKQVASLEQKLKAAEASAAAVPPPQSEVKQSAGPVSGPAPEENTRTAMNVPDLLWLAISFAMLVTGFIGGVVWLRERTRRKLGGMHIRVS